MEKLDEGFKTLLELGKRRGFLTYDQLNDNLPEEVSSSPEKLHELLERLDELGIELVNEEEAESRLVDAGVADDDADDEVVDDAGDDDEDDGELTPEDLDEISRRIDDPVRMYLTQMGEIPLLTRDQEIELAKRIEITRKKFRRRVLECDYALRLVVDVLQQEAKFGKGDEVAVLQRERKKRVEAAEAYEGGGRAEQAAAERFEAELIEGYLPQQLSDEELAALVAEAVAETCASEQKQMGQVMSALMPKLGGRADGKRVSAAVRAKLGGA